jgi:hypothetical protein
MELTLPVNRNAFASETLTVSNAVKALTAATYQVALSSNSLTKEFARTALITVEGQSLRWTVNPAVTVSATDNGHLAMAGSFIVLTTTTDIQNFRAIRTSGSDSTINVTYFI